MTDPRRRCRELASYRQATCIPDSEGQRGTRGPRRFCYNLQFCLPRRPPPAALGFSSAPGCF